MSINPVKYIITIIMAMVFLWLAQPGFFVVDEVYHLDQITTLVAGQDTHLPNITTFIFLHQAYAWLGQQMNITDLFQYRWINTVFALLYAVILYWVATNQTQKNHWLLASQMFFLPVVFPYYNLVYTDIPALLLLVAAAYLVTQNKHMLAAILGALAVWVRQPSLIWLGFFALMAVYPHWVTERIKWLKALKSCWPYGLVILGFLIYFWFNKSVALGDKGHHTVSINLTNVYFMALIASLVFLPLVINRSQRAWQLFKNQPWLWFVCLIGLLVYVYTFNASHPFNDAQYNQFLRNLTLNSMIDHGWLMTLVYVFCFFSMIALSTYPLATPANQLLYWIIPLSVLPMPLIEQRYYMVGLTLWMLWRQPARNNIELIQLLWMMAASGILYWGVANHWFYF